MSGRVGTRLNVAADGDDGDDAADDDCDEDETGLVLHCKVFEFILHKLAYFFLNAAPSQLCKYKSDGV